MVRNKLKTRRIIKGYTQEQVAEAAGISRNFYTNIENGQRGCGMDKWLKIAKCLDIPESDLISFIMDQKGA